VASGTPVLRETNVVLLHGGLPAGVVETQYRHERFRFEARIDLGAYPQVRGGR
jgi:DNA-binding GntR family transcriptional regulator